MTIYDETALKYNMANRAANIPGLIKSYYSTVLLLAQYRDEHNAGAALPGGTDSRERYMTDAMTGFFTDDEISFDLFDAIAQAETVITDWDIDHPEILAL